jgi:hypothetical protein
MAKSNIMPYVNSFTIWSWLTTYNASSILMVIPQFYTWMVLNNVDLHFSHVLVRIANAVEKETRWAV